MTVVWAASFAYRNSDGAPMAIYELAKRRDPNVDHERRRGSDSLRGNPAMKLDKERSTVRLDEAEMSRRNAAW